MYHILRVPKRSAGPGAGSQQGVRENWELKICGGSKEEGVKGGKDEKEKKGEVKRTKTAEERKPSAGPLNLKHALSFAFCVPKRV